MEKILNISKNLGLSHIGSNISVFPILEEIYAKKKPGDIVILDNAHAHLAHLIAWEDYEKRTKGFTEPYESGIQNLIQMYGIHCDRRAGCDASGGSLGHGLGIGIGYALAFPNKTIHVIVSDGSMMEGSNWEALRIKNDRKLKNLKIHCNFNGYTAVAKIHPDVLINRMRVFCLDIEARFTRNGSEFDGVEGHYKVLEK